MNDKEIIIEELRKFAEKADSIWASRSWKSESRKWALDEIDKSASTFATTLLAKLNRGKVIAIINLKSIYYGAGHIEIKLNGYPKKLALGSPIEKDKSYKLILEVEE